MQLRAWSRRRSASISPSTSLPQRTQGTGPNSVPASERNVPAWTSPTWVLPPSSIAQSTASFIAMGGLWRGGQERVVSRWNADAVGSDWPWYLERSSGEPYGRSAGELILKKL